MDNNELEYLDDLSMYEVTKMMYESKKYPYKHIDTDYRYKKDPLKDIKGWYIWSEDIKLPFKHKPSMWNRFFVRLFFGWKWENKK
jgi:hypothetical protein